MPCPSSRREDKGPRCRLCVIGAGEEGWKYAKRVLRYLKRDHLDLEFTVIAGQHRYLWIGGLRVALVSGKVA